VTDLVDLSGLLGALREARQARLAAQQAGDEMEELAADLRQAPPVGRWPHLTRASFAVSVVSD